MVKNCPKCGKELPDDAKFCMDCGYTLDSHKNINSSIFSNGKIFIILIAIVLIVGGLVILTSGGNNSDEAVDNVEHVDLTITDTLGWDSDSGSYTLYTDALFNSVPSDIKGYNVKVTYYDANDTKIGQETDSLEHIYYDSDYALTLCYYTTYKKPNPDHVTVEIIKDGKTIDTFTENIDQSKIDFLN